MKIYINARFLTQPISGVQRYGIECSRQIKILIPDAIFLAPRNIRNKNVANELGVQVTGTHTGHLWEQVDLPRYLSSIGSPPLFSPANTAPLFYRNNFFTLHDLAFLFYPQWNSKLFASWYNFLMPRLAKKSRHIFTVSDTVKNEIISNYKVPAVKVAVTYNGISQEMLATHDQYTREKENIILSVGSFNKRKNHHLLIQAFIASGLKATHQLVIVGDEHKVFAATSIDAAMLHANNIRICQHFSDTELMDMYASASVLVSLSAYEGFGIPLLEGLFYGCRLVCSDIPVYRELFSTYAHFCGLDQAAIIAALTTATTIASGSMPLAIEQTQLAHLLEKYSYAASARTIVHTILHHHNAL